MPSVMPLLLVHYLWPASDPVGCPGPDVAPAQPCPLNCPRRRELELKHWFMCFHVLNCISNKIYLQMGIAVSALISVLRWPGRCGDGSDDGRLDWTHKYYSVFRLPFQSVSFILLWFLIIFPTILLDVISAMNLIETVQRLSNKTATNCLNKKLNTLIICFQEFDLQHLDRSGA